MTRIGASQAFFNIVANFNAQKLIKDVGSLRTVMRAVQLDTIEAFIKPFDEMGMQLQAVMDATRELGKELGFARTEFEKFFGVSPQMEAMSQNIIEMGEAFAMTAVESLAAGSRAAQVANIIGQANVDLLVEQAMILSEISDLNVEESQRALIKLQQQANIFYGDYTDGMVRGMSVEKQRAVLTENSAKALDALNTIANRSVALEGDLVQTMTNFASQGHLVGESFEFMAAASATLLEAGEEQGTAGRALRMMYARLGGNINGAADELEALGIRVRDSNGDILTMQEVLGNVSEKGWDNMSASLKMNIAQTISGNRHYVRFIKLMDNYERTVRLAEEGQLGLDSALEQSNRALAKQAHNLAENEAKITNLQASIGEKLTPTMIGATAVEADYLEMTNDLLDGLGGLGEVFGRLQASLKITGGMFKFGLAIQSIGVGIGMYESVMKSLHGIEVANQSLHSKEANHLDFAVSLDEKRLYLKQAMQYLQQAMNANNETARHAQKEIAFLERNRPAQLERINELEERNVERKQKQLKLSIERNSLDVLELDLSKRQNSSYQRKLAYIEHDKRIQGELLEMQKQLYSSRTFAEDAYKRQFITDVTMMQNLGKRQVAQIRENTTEHRKLHSVLQDIKTANEIVRGQQKGSEQITRMVGKLRSQDYNRLKERIALETKYMTLQRRGRDERTGDILQDRTEQQEATDKRFLAFMELKRAAKELHETGKLTVGGAGFAKEGFEMLKEMLEKVGGEIVQVDRLMQAFNANLTQRSQIQDRLNVIDEFANRLMEEGADEMKEVQRLRDEGLITDERVEALQVAINKAKNEEIKHLREFKDIVAIVKGEKEELGRLQQKYDIDDAARMAKAQGNFMMSTKQAGMALTSFTSIMGGMVGGHFGVAMSMNAMGVQFAGAAFQVGAATNSLMKNSLELLKNINFLNQGNRAAAAYSVSMGLVTAAIVAASVAMTVFAKKQAQQRKEMLRLNENAANFTDTMQSLEKDTMLFGGDNALAAQFGLADMELDSLFGNTEKINDVLAKMNENSGLYSQEQNQQIEKAKQMLTVLLKMEDSSNAILDKKKFDEQAKQLRNLSSSSTLLSERGRDTLFLGAGDIEAGRDFLQEIDAGLGSLEKHKGLNGLIYEDVLDMQLSTQDQMHIIESAVDRIGEVGGLTAREWELLRDAFGSKDWANEILDGLRNLEAFTLTADEAAYFTSRFDDVINNTADDLATTTDEVKNLTEEMTNFASTREELFFGGKYGNITGSLYKQVVSQGVGVLYNKNEVLVSNVFHGFFNEQEAAERISAIVKREIEAVLD